jgi:hypothetical protein
MNTLKALLTTALLAALMQPALARQSPAKQQAGRPAPAAVRKTDAAREAALSLLVSLADEARTFRDDGLGASVQAKAADLLWAEQPDAARVIFRRAWEQAARADDESQRKVDEARRRYFASTDKGPAMLPNPSNFRGEIINLSGVHDRALAEEFLSQLAKPKDAESNDTTSSPVGTIFASLDAPPADRQRLILAKDLLDAGDTKQALVFADPALSGPVNLPVIHFLSFLHEKAPQEADTRYLRLCAAAASDPASDANTVSLLSSYLFTPLLAVVFDPKGGRGSSSWRERPVAPPEASPQLRAAFFNTAAAILLRPLPAPEQDHTSSGRPGLWMEITRLLPLFALYAPERVPELEARRAELLPDTPERSRDEKRLRQWMPGEQSENTPQDYADALAKARTQNERDAVNASWAFTISGKDFEQARERAMKIENQDVRTQLLALLTLDEASRLVRKANADGALKLVATDSLSPSQLVWLYCSCARLLKGRDPERSRQLVEEATSAAHRLDDRSPARAHALLAVAASSFDLDAAGGWPALEEAVRAANDAPDFTGDGRAFTADVRTKVFVGSTSGDASALDLKALFAAVAKLDFQRAVAEAKGLSNDSARSTALLAAARAVLTKEPATRKK